jgi:signal transduction histidine kinase
LSLDEASTLVTQNDENFSLSNVIRYTAENGRIDVSLSIEGNIAVLEALDAESGKNDEDLDRVLTAFYSFPRHDGLSPTGT